MKTVEDFKVVNGIAILEGVSFAEEAMIVDEFLKVHTDIKQASVVTNDQRSFRLDNGKLILTKDKTFINPYFEQTIDEEKSISYPHTNKVNGFNLEQRVVALEKDLFENKNLLKSIISLLTTFVEK